MTFDDYAKIGAVSWTTLKEMRRSPRHYAYRVAHPLEDTARLARGRAVHTAVFEPDRFLLDYALFEGERRAGKAWDAFEAANAEKTILKRPEYQLCLDVRDAVREHPVAGRLLSSGRAEQTIQWTDEGTGLACKGRIDWHAPGLILDLKTCPSVDARRFGWISARMGYHCQMALYRAGMRANGHDPAVKLIAVEMDPPHDIAVFALGDDELYAGEEEVRELLQRVAECRKLGEWPGAYPEEAMLELPRWCFPGDEEDLGLVIGQEA